MNMGAGAGAGTYNVPAGQFLDGFFTALKAAGITGAVVSPGSRSTPLAMKAYEHFGDVWLVVDERSAAFFALGMAKVSGMPVPVICTSGTAVGNWMPAVLEAEASMVPMLLLSADRPGHLQGVGAPQTTNQVRIFGDHVRAFTQMPELGPASLAPAEGFAAAGAAAARDALAVACGTASSATGTHTSNAAGNSVGDRVSDTLSRASAVHGGGGAPGLVHLNFPFDEPLIPSPAPPELGAGALLSTPEHAGTAAPADAAPSPARTAESSEEGGELAAISQQILEAINGLDTIIVAGEGAVQNRAEAEALLALARTLGVPIVADVLSGMRALDDPLILTNYDSYSGQWPTCEAVLRFGAWPVSKRLVTQLSTCGAMQIAIGRYGALDYTRTAAATYTAVPSLLATELAAQARAAVGKEWSLARSAEAVGDVDRAWIEADENAGRRIAAHAHAAGPRHEAPYVAQVASAAPEDSLIWAANSMAIRHLDTFLGRRRLHVRANRGLNGIDGTLASAFGAAVQSGRPLTVLTGDLAFLYDAASLALREELERHGHRAPIAIVCLNNGGGAIFDMLAQRSSDPYFERLFLTPHSADFAGAAHMHGCAYERTESPDSFATAYEQALSHAGITVLDIPLELAGLPERFEGLW